MKRKAMFSTKREKRGYKKTGKVVQKRQASGCKKDSQVGVGNMTRGSTNYEGGKKGQAMESKETGKKVE